MSSVRAFPAPKHARPVGWSGAWCRWCAEPIITGRKDRTAHDGRDRPDGRKERNCRLEYRLHTDRDAQFTHVAERDGKQCWSCKATPMKWVRGSEAYIGGRPGGETPSYANPLAMMQHGTRYCSVERVTALELEHTVPLWSTTHLSNDERRPLFGPANLRLLGPCCHKPKTKAEAQSRAKEKRQAQMCVGAERRETKNPIRSRGFDSQHRPMQSRNTFATRKRP